MWVQCVPSSAHKPIAWKQTKLTWCSQEQTEIVTHISVYFTVKADYYSNVNAI